MRECKVSVVSFFEQSDFEQGRPQGTPTLPLSRPRPYRDYAKEWETFIVRAGVGMMWGWAPCGRPEDLPLTFITLQHHGILTHVIIKR